MIRVWISPEQLEALKRLAAVSRVDHPRKMFVSGFYSRIVQLALQEYLRKALPPADYKELFRER